MKHDRIIDSEGVRRHVVSESERLSEETLRVWAQKSQMRKMHFAGKIGNTKGERANGRRLAETAGGHRRQKNGNNVEQH